MQEYFSGTESALWQAREYYSGSLDIQEYADTRHNYDFASSLMQIPEKNESTEDQQEWNKADENTTTENTALSQPEILELEQITEQIKAQQDENQKYYNKPETTSDFQNSFDTHFGEINRGWEKNW